MSVPPRRDNGQAMVEFAIVFPIAILVIVGIIAGSFILYQKSAVTDGAKGGSRMAGVETTLYTSSTGTFTCEGGSPDTIVDAVRKSINIVPVNTAPLCAYSTTELQQYPVDPNKANIVVDAYPSLASPQCVTVSVTYKANPLALPFTGSFTLQGHSSVQIAASSTTTSSSTSTATNCPAPGSPRYSITTSPG